MFLIRTAFWLALLIMILPANEQQQQDVYGTAEATIEDLKSFCVRNAEVCEKSKSALETFGQKAQFGAKLLMGFVKDATGDGAAEATQASLQAEPRARPSLFQRSSQNTLREDDLQPAWAAPRPAPGI